MSDRIELNVKMQVTVPQALALQAMFEHWNRLGSIGSSRMIGFYVDGDGNFQPKCEVTTSVPIPQLTDDLRQAAMVSNDGNGTVDFDFDGIAWKLR